MRVKISTLLIFAGSLVLTGVLSTGCRRQVAQAGPPPKVEPAAVTVATATDRTEAEFLGTTGSLAAEESARVAADASGLVATIPIDTGTVVAQGAVIATLNDREATLRLDQARAAEAQAAAALKQAEAKLGQSDGAPFDPLKSAEAQSAQADLDAAESTLKLAEATYERYAQLAKNDNVPRMVFDQAQRDRASARAAVVAARRRLDVAVNASRQDFQGVAVARAQYEQAKAQTALAQKAVADRVIRAPFAGIVSARLVNRGEYVTTDTPLAEIVRPSPLKLQLQVSETDAARIAIGRPVTALVDAFPEETFSGKVTAINPRVDPQARMLTVEVRLPNPDNRLRPGMFAKARIETGGAGKSVLIPRDAVTFNTTTNSASVYVVENDRARLRIVQPGEPDGVLIRILSGVAAGERVIVGTVEKLFDGATVRATDR